MAEQLTAYVDESTVRLSNNRRLYAMAAVLITSAQHTRVSAALRGCVLPDRSYLHHYDETYKRRCLIARTIAELALDGAIIVAAVTTNQAQERARAHILTALLPRLQYQEHVAHVVIEPRHRSDKHDARTRDRLRRSRSITSELRVYHIVKQADPLLWLPDFVAGALFAARYHDEREPWEIINAAHYIDVVNLPERL